MKNEELKEKVIEKLKSVYDPEIPVNIYDLGLVYSIEFEVKNNYTYCTVEMTLTSPSCPVSDSLVEQVKYYTQSVDEIDEAYVHLVFEPMWQPSMMSEEAREIMSVSGAAI
ncbi:metal-sulfur cluster assembly factor [Halarcobacter ebronensis]|uniref:FeS assembly SUF system protein n=1 Tax=Halarcobacter ebronensis TaxID=1462615 RepID=A0A4Q1AME7_9BACT|nr:iron-sulfur cluster assembly protein [Halarcobacter ebronensis]QKF81343.1 [Fe-S] cluster assembly protein [Halarcobacter ebronensis]RXK04904.1 FeS assembly SUF system protein [Halarcobacter ebronensis]